MMAVCTSHESVNLSATSAQSDASNPMSSGPIAINASLSVYVSAY